MSAKSYSASDFKFAEIVQDKVSPHGHVCITVMNNGTPDEKLVVIKSLRQSLAAKAEESFTASDVKKSMSYVNEAHDLRKFGDSCPWLNQFFGYTFHKDERGRVAALLVWELIPSYGPVVEVLEGVERQRGNRVSFAVRCDWMRKLLKATKYLHEQNAAVGNLKSRNVFIDKDLNIKLTDYSTTCWFDLQSLAHPLFQRGSIPISYDLDEKSGIPSTVEGSSSDLSRKDFKHALPYLSKERLRGEMALQSDVYSLGVVCWEITTGSYVDAKRVLKNVVEAANLDIACGILNCLFDRNCLPHDTPVEVLDLLNQCGVGSLGHSNPSISIDGLCQEFEQPFAILSTRLRMDAEVARLKSLDFRTTHMDRIDQCLQTQKRRRESRIQTLHSGSHQIDLSSATPKSISRPPPSTQRSSQTGPKSSHDASAAMKSSADSTGFQRLVMDQNQFRRNQVQPRVVATKGHEQIDLTSGSCSVQIMTQSMQNVTFIQDSNVVINAPSVARETAKTTELKVDPVPPPRGVLTESVDEINRDDEKLLNRNPISMEKWELLAKNLQLTEGQISDLKMRHRGMSELSCRLLEAWKERESENATKKRLALALWLADEQDLAKKVQ